MPKFSKSNMKELKKLLYNSCVHDASMENLEYRCREDCIKIELLHPYFNYQLDMTFHNIELVFAKKGQELGSRETVISLTVEEDYSYLQTYLSKCNEYPENALYLLFQMLSGDELHIVSKEVTVEINGLNIFRAKNDIVQQETSIITVPQAQTACGTRWRLASAAVGGKTYSYEYNSSGIRTRKTNYDGGYTEYYVVNGLPVAEQRFRTNGTKQYILRYLFDDGNIPVGFGIYYPTASSPYWQYYYFSKNPQGDVIALYRSDYNSTSKSYTPTLIATYSYDPWGAPTGIYDANGSTISQTAYHVAAYNPFRYRGYRYDGDTRLYYLQSRYYDPVVGRFINADGYASTGQGLIGHNMFAYCLNNPVYYSDSTGHRPHVFSNFKKILRRVPQALNNAARKIGINTAALGAPSLNMYKDSKGIYHAKSNCWQKNFGYCSFYDAAFDTATYMKNERFRFESDGTKYTFWLWCGSYINLGAGAEMGLYTEDGWMVSANHDITLPMSMTLVYDGTTIIDYSDTTWWITGFNPNYSNVLPDQLTVTFTIDFSSRPGMFRDFYSQCADDGWSFDLKNHLAIYSF